MDEPSQNIENENETCTSERSLNIYQKKVLEAGITNTKLIQPSSVVTAEWVRWKCQFGCAAYGQGWCCPPETPKPEETRKMLDSYQRAILFHLEIQQSLEPEERKTLGKSIRRKTKALVDLEGEMFKDGFYKAFVFLSGPCGLCKPCGKTKNESCQCMDRARPSMESCGIDVYQTARNNGFSLKPLHDKSETQHNFCLLMVD